MASIAGAAAGASRSAVKRTSVDPKGFSFQQVSYAIAALKVAFDLCLRTSIRVAARKRIIIFELVTNFRWYLYFAPLTRVNGSNSGIVASSS